VLEDLFLKMFRIEYEFSVRKDFYGGEDLNLRSCEDGIKREINGGGGCHATLPNRQTG